MFNRSTYDRTLYDRSSEFNSVEASLRASSNVTFNITIQVYLESIVLSGSGNIQGTPSIQQTMQIPLSGEGSSEINDIRLRIRISSLISGEGDAIPGVGSRVPFNTIFSSTSDCAISVMYFLQTVISRLSSYGNVSLLLSLRVYLNPLIESSGNLSMTNQFRLRLPISVAFYGNGNLEFHRIGELNTDTLEFNDLNLSPGQTLIIDTDELNVFIDNILNVDSITSDSVFFNLYPGENEITFVSNVNPNLSVTLIWQNRWL